MKNKFIGQTVQFTSKIEELESELDSGMKAVLIDVVSHRDGMVIAYFDTSRFKEHNEVFMKPNYWDNSTPRKACFTAKQAGLWPENEKHSIYFMDSDDFLSYMTIAQNETKI